MMKQNCSVNLGLCLLVPFHSFQLFQSVRCSDPKIGIRLINVTHIAAFSYKIKKQQKKKKKKKKKKKLTFKSSGHINKKGNGPYRGFGHLRVYIYF